MEINPKELSEASREEGLFTWAFALEVGEKEYRGELPDELVDQGIAERPAHLRRIFRR